MNKQNFEMLNKISQKIRKQYQFKMMIEENLTKNE